MERLKSAQVERLEESIRRFRLELEAGALSAHNWMAINEVEALQNEMRRVEALPVWPMARPRIISLLMMYVAVPVSLIVNLIGWGEKAYRQVCWIFTGLPGCPPH